MSIDRAVLVVAGGMILLTLLLSLASPVWLWLTALVGVNLIQSAFTGFCPAAIVLKKFGFKSGQAFD
ncbi:MAG: DUF2892 domain-containing protein [Ectothiorhodospira sp.]